MDPKKPNAAHAPHGAPAANVKDICVTAAGPNPASFPAKVGDAVKWVNDGDSDVEVVFDPADPKHPGSVPPPNSGPIKAGADYGYTFTAPGEYKYTVGGKKGTVVVTS